MQRRNTVERESSYIRDKTTVYDPYLYALVFFSVMDTFLLLSVVFRGFDLARMYVCSCGYMLDSFPGSPPQGGGEPGNEASYM